MTSKTINIGLLIARVTLGASMVIHGLPKLMGGAAKWEGIGKAMGFLGINFAPVFWGACASFAEFFGGAFILLGIFMRPSTLAVASTMTVAAIFHLAKGDGFMRASHAIELGLFAIALFFTGPGAFSLKSFYKKGE